MDETVALIKPTAGLAADFRALGAEFAADGNPRYEDACRNVGAFIQRCEDHEAGRNLPQGWVPQSTYWLVRRGERILGCSRLRHQLNPALSQQGGHIGYDIRPSERGKGYGSLLLRLTLLEARKAGLASVLITATDGNVASWKVIEKNGGRREGGCFSGDGGPFRRYWVAT